MPTINAPRGCNDILPKESWKWQAIEKIAREVSELYNFSEIRTPIFEHTELFHRGVGETSDIVHKETYTFTDRGDRSITLRPEGTAGVVRAAIEQNLIAQEGARQKLYYIGPNFRYEKPQSGRLRQHHQFGAEVFGIADADQDVECILLQLDFYRRCGLNELELQINSLGDAESKQRYRNALVAFLAPKKDKLSEDSQRRLDENPLRILDSKDPRDRDAVQGAPPASESLSERSSAHFQRVQHLLTISGVDFKVNHNLVRGFDYYTETLWEVTAGGLGAQNAIGGGGRYDNLVEMLGGRPVPGVGFGAGLERLLMALDKQKTTLADHRKKLVYFVNQGPQAKDLTWKLLAELRAAGFSADTDLTGRSMKAQLKIATREEAEWCILIGDAELASHTVIVRNLRLSEQQTVRQDALIDHLRQLLG